jgi:hypothetical protein
MYRRSIRIQFELFSEFIEKEKECSLFFLLLVLFFGCGRIIKPKKNAWLLLKISDVPLLTVPPLLLLFLNECMMVHPRYCLHNTPFLIIF